MLAALTDGGGAAVTTTPAPPQPQPTPTGGGPQPQPTPQPTVPVNALGETLQQAEAAVLAAVARGETGAQALAEHPLPTGTSTAEALAFLAELPQTTYAIDSTQGTVTGPPLNPPPPTPDSGPQNSVEETTLQAYKPPGIVLQWRNLLDVFKVTAPKKRDAVTAMFDNPKEFWK